VISHIPTKEREKYRKQTFELLWKMNQTSLHSRTAYFARSKALTERIWSFRVF